MSMPIWKGETLYCVLVNGEMLPQSLSLTKEGAGSWRGDAKRAGPPNAEVLVVAVRFFGVKQPKEDDDERA
jgi:hypothetical protein